jgi:hypothetical protein
VPTRPEQFPYGSSEDVAQRLALLRRALVSVVDFREAMSSWSAQRHVSLEGDHHGEPLQESVARALRSAAIVAYARPFLGSNTPFGSPQRRDRLFLEDIGYKEGVEYSKWWFDLHNVILTLRGKFIAHADTDHAGRNPAVRARLEPDGTMEVQVEINNYYAMLEDLESDRVWRLFDIVEDNTQRLAYRHAEELISDGHLQNSDLKPDERPRSLLLQLRRKMPPASTE